jgi:hypothetical protein
MGAEAGWSRIGLTSGNDRRRRELGATIGVGVEWLPTQRVSVGGHIGVHVSMIRVEAPSPGFGIGGNSTGSQVGTYSSGVRVRLFL